MVASRPVGREDGAAVMVRAAPPGPARPLGVGTVFGAEYARLLKGQGDTLSHIATKTGIPKTSLHRYLIDPTTV